MNSKMQLTLVFIIAKLAYDLYFRKYIMTQIDKKSKGYYDKKAKKGSNVS